jgi:hypothetical protein
MENAKHLTKNAVAARYSVTTRTVDRWLLDEKLGFPTPMRINARHYYRQDELAEFDMRCALRAACDRRKGANAPHQWLPSHRIAFPIGRAWHE